MMSPVRPTLVNPPTTLREHDAEQAARQAEVIDIADRFAAVLHEVEDCTHTPGRLTAKVYDAITLERSVVAVHCQGQVLAEDGFTVIDARFVLWFDAKLAQDFGKQLVQLADHVEQRNIHKDDERRFELGG